jgi:hypothetical protein
MLYYIRSMEHEQQDGVVVWWGKNRHGYTNNLHEAGLYSQSEAEEIVADANRYASYPNEEMVPQAIAEKAAGWLVGKGRLEAAKSGYDPNEGIFS